jgi:hypothetical protein
MRQRGYVTGFAAGGDGSFVNCRFFPHVDHFDHWMPALPHYGVWYNDKGLSVARQLPRACSCAS